MSMKYRKHHGSRAIHDRHGRRRPGHKKLPYIYLGYLFLVMSSPRFLLAEPQPTDGVQADSAGGGSVKKLKKSETMTTISMGEAFQRSLIHHHRLVLEKNLLSQVREETSLRIGSLLPKVNLNSSYTRNIPDVKSSLSPRNSLPGSLEKQVAGLLRKAGDNSAADQLEKRADLAMRRNEAGQIVINPKDLITSVLSIEVPLFNGPDIARVIASRERYFMQNARIDVEQANTIYLTAKAYFLAAHMKNILRIRRKAEVSSKEQFLNASARREQGLILEKDYLLAKASYFERQAEHQGAIIDHGSSIAELGLLLGMSEEYQIEDPDDIIFKALNDDADTLIQVAMRDRPDIKESRYAIDIARSERLSSFLRFLPVLSLNADAKYSSNDKSLVGKSFTYAITLNASLNLFDGGKSLSELRIAALKRSQSELKHRYLQMEVDTKIRGQKSKVEQLSLLNKARELKLLAAREAELLALDRYDKGLIQLEELLENSERRLNAEINLKKSQYDVNVEKLALSYEAGLLTPQFVK